MAGSKIVDFYKNKFIIISIRFQFSALMSQPPIPTLVLLDIDGCVYPGGRLGFIIPWAEKLAIKLKTFSSTPRK
jgi:hypothetical protein